MNDTVPAAPQIIDAVRRGAPVWLAGREYVPAASGPAPSPMLSWQFRPGEPVELVVVLGGQVVYQLVGSRPDAPQPFPLIAGWHRRLVRAALEQALEQLDMEGTA